MTPKRALIPALFLAALLLGGCAAPPEKTVSRGHVPEIVDQREAPLALAKVAEGDATRFYVGEAFFGPPLIDLFHREVAIQNPRFPEPTTLTLTELEVSILVPTGGQLLDPSQVMRGKGDYRPAPGGLVLDERGREAHTVRVTVVCHHQGHRHEVELTDTVTADEARQRAMVLFNQAVDALIDQLATPG